MIDLFSFDSAVARISAQSDNTSFAFLPEARSGNVVGGTIFTLTGYDDGQLHLTLMAEGGRFWSSIGEEAFYPVESLDEDIAELQEQYGIDPRQLHFKACTAAAICDATGLQTEYALAILNGMPEQVPSSPKHVPPAWSQWLIQHLPAEHAQRQVG